MAKEETKAVPGKTIGIDLGTTFSAVAVMEAGKSTIIPNAEGDRTTPSVVTIKDGERLVGKMARNQAIVHPENTIRSIKRLMGSDEKVSVDIWNWKDKQLQPQQLKQLDKEIKRSYKAVYFTGNDKIVQLADEKIKSVSVNKEIEGDYCIGYYDEPYLRMRSWEASRSSRAWKSTSSRTRWRIWVPTTTVSTWCTSRETP